jgi:capsular exopolysaccharide synthesis family protein
MDIAQFWKVLRNYWWLPLSVVLLAVIGTVLITNSRPPVYQTSTHLVVTQAQSLGPQSYDDVLASEQLAATYSALLQSPPFLQRAITQLRLPLSVASLGSKVSTQVLYNTSLIQLTVQDTDRTRAATIANGLAQVLRSYAQGLQAHATQDAAQRVNQQLADLSRAMSRVDARLNSLRPANAASAAQVQRLQNESTQDRNRYNALLTTQQQLAAAQAEAAATVSVVGPALVPTTPVGSGTTRNLALAVVLGLLFGLGGALLIARLDDRVRDIRDVDGLVDVTLVSLGYIRGGAPPLLIGSTVARGSRFAQALLLLRAHIERVRDDRQVTLCVTSAHPCEGTSTVAANLAQLESQAGKRVILIDANLRDPQLHLFFDVPNHPGLSDILLLGEAGAEPPLQQGPLGLKILTAGRPVSDPGGVLSAPQLTDLVRSLQDKADLIIIDTPPLSLAPDALLLQGAVTGTVLVVDARHTRLRAIGASVEALEEAGGALWSVVLNKTAREAIACVPGNIHALHNGLQRRERADDAAEPAPQPLSPVG